jgi:hypothetical protein
MAATDAGYAPEVICVEPYPTPFLQNASAEGRLKLMQQKVEESPPDVGRILGDGGLFFVDSTHALGPGGEVSRIILDLLPELARGVEVHFHDITFPYDYPRYTLTRDFFFSHETSLLLGFLSFNSRVRVMASLSMLHYSASDELARCLPNYRPAGNDDGLQGDVPGHYPSSIYLKVD